MARAIRSLISFGFLLHAVSSWAGIEAIYGDWEGGDRGTEAIFGTMTITRTHLSWKGKSQRESRCTVRYKQIPEGYGVRFKDQVGTEFVSAPDSSFQTFLLKIEGAKPCALGITHFRLTLHEDLPVPVLNDIEYRGLNNPIGWGHYFRPLTD